MAQNRLADQTSPYLLQHADNPVDWWPWGPEALSEAKENNKPILLSVGYAACHWCHVMAHESFESEEIAKQMNELFVNIKVDREERPDLDTIYQHAIQILGQQGGWPLTMFLTPDGEPFWGGTYFPAESKFGRPGFPDVLNTIHSYWTDKQDSVSQNVTALRESLAQMGVSESGGEIDLSLVERAAQRLVQEYDTVNGGIGTAPKFPNPSILELLWRTYKRCGHEDLKQAVLLSMEKMSQGGIYDHLGGGYARYSTDAIWLAPHFEKMLYDNAQLLDLLTWVWQQTDDPLFKQRAHETVDWVLREMIADGGAFAATLDADSEGEEGKFYVWNQSEIEEVLEADAPLFIEAYDVQPDGNWEGKTILNRTNNSRSYSGDEEDILANCRNKLLAERDKRIRPGWDDKVLADWNGLMIPAMAQAGVVFGKSDWIIAARKAFAFVSETMNENGKLFHAYRNGKVNHDATLDDYAGMIRAALSLYEAAGDKEYLQNAQEWVATVDKQFWDHENGGYFFTADDAEALIVRTKTAADNATPGGNSVMITNLGRLYYLTGETKYRDRADQTIAAFSGELSKNFFPFAALMNSAEFLQQAIQIAIIGERGKEDCEAILSAVFKSPNLNKVVSVISPNEALPENHPASGKGQLNDAATAYICVGQTCSLPITEAQDVAIQLDSAPQRQ
ncbi:MAG: thioredoxin domain-containing protein [Rhodospirillaceae bacterium]|nr:thioredoxin domain-containing protein [Rhodospirillaceae bacterium]|tara:strand:- start:23389 stop:25419 length:2031 start_codon:yes stop_codon:yes gene_type:complete